MGASITAGLAHHGANRTIGEFPRQDQGQCFNTHLLVELWSAPFPKLADARHIEDALGFAGSYDGDMGTEKPADVRVHQFDPYGVSGTATSPLIHILIHTWPEKNYASVDIFSHGRDEAYLVLERVKKALCPEYVHVLEMRRGQLLDMEDT